MEDSIEGFGITQNKLAVSIGVSPRRINETVHGKREITADTAIRLARFFGTSEELWMNLQSNYELRLEAILSEGSRAGTFRLQDAKIAAYAIIAMLTGVNTWFREGGRLSRAEVGDSAEKPG